MVVGDQARLRRDRVRQLAVFSSPTWLGRRSRTFASLVRLPRTSIADEMREEHRRRVLGE